MGSRAVLGAAFAWSLGAAAVGQSSDISIHPEPAPAAPAAVVEVDPEVREAQQRMQQRRATLERDLKKIRARYFRNIRNTEIRQAGIAQLRQYNDPAIFPSLLEVFADEGEDVRGAIIDHLASLRTEEADITIAWAAVFDEDKAIRADAAARLSKRFANGDAVPRGVKSVVASGLRREDSNQTITAAAHLANVLNLAEAIPMLINAQIGGANVQLGRGGGTRTGDLANIVIGTQVAFVSDLRPVVGDSAVAFDPTISVITDGVTLRVMDAVVLTYRTEVHNSLLGLSSRLWGRPTDGLGWDDGLWRKWHDEEFLPEMERRRRELASATPAPNSAAAQAGASPAQAPGAPTAPPGGG